MCDLGGDTLGVALHLPERCESVSNQNYENTHGLEMLPQAFLGEFILAHSHGAEKHEDVASLGESLNPAAKTACQAHQVGVIQMSVFGAHPVLPGAKTFGPLSRREIGIDHVTIHKIGLVFKKIVATLAELVRHNRTIIT